MPQNDSLLIQVARKYLSPDQVDFVIYHSPCFDGFGSALAAWKHLGKKATYLPMSYEKQLPDLTVFKDKHILVVDFSFDINTLKKLRQHAKKVMILDHHKTALETLGSQEGAFFEMKKSGAMLCFEYFNTQNESCPEFYKLVEDRDIWNWQYRPRTEPLHGWLSLVLEKTKDKFNFNFRNFAPLLDSNILETYIQKGLQVLEDNVEWVEKTSKEALEATWKIDQTTYRIKYIILKSQKLSSELGHKLLEDPSTDFVMLIQRLPEAGFKVSLRSKGNMDVGNIAKQLGGGGHKNAAGFTCPTDPLALLNTKG
ncbi:MAG: hypothetical protein H6586_08825 [Flavobacteriales bacterium]|nr:hypothetical protein [Flavobacteriales bacterium]